MNKTELAFVGKALSRGKGGRVLRDGWPDFLIVESGAAYAVEVKSSTDILRPSQFEMFCALEELGIKVMVWNPDKPDVLMPFRKWPRCHKSKMKVVRRGRAREEPRLAKRVKAWEEAARDAVRLAHFQGTRKQLKV